MPSHLLLLAALAAAPFAPAPAVPSGAELRRAAPDAEVSLMVGLSLHDQAGLDALLAAQHEPTSPQFRQWLTPAQFGDRFGQPAARYEAIAHELARTGLSVERYPSRLLLHARGDVAQLEALLGVTFWDVTTSSGLHFRTYRGTPHLSDSLAREVQSLSGLDTRPRYKRRLAVPAGYDVFGPQDLRRYYDMSALHAQGFAGQLSRVGIVGPIPDTADFPNPQDLAYFYGSVADADAQFQIVNLGLQGSQPDTQGDRVELELDAEMSVVAAPRERSITMVLAPGDTMFVQGMAYFANVDYGVTAVSTSYGDCEAAEVYFTPGEILTVANLVAQGSAEGISWFAASGDNGADDCGTGPVYADGGGGDGAQVDFPGSIPYMVSVGGTGYTGSFDSHDAITSYGHETTWNSGGNNGAGGGGVSQLFAAPSYQQGTVSGAMREVPDFSLIADPNTGVAVDDTRPGLIDGSGGTSDAAPMAAGIFALLNDYIGGCRIGAPQFELYRLGRSSARSAVFHDITTGNLTQNGVTGPSAGTGFDDATGWGSLDVAALAQHWPPCAGPLSSNNAGPLYPDGGWPTDDAGLYDPGEYDGGLGPTDAGARPAYDACTVIACDGGATCQTVTEGPSYCDLPCTPGGANTCPSGDWCDPSQSRCVPGCGADSDCAANEKCDGCAHSCSAIRVDAGALGDPCNDDSACPTFGFCLTPDPTYNLPDGYCSAFCDPTAAACQCPPDAQCDGTWQLCLRTCSVNANGTCADQQVCNDFRNGDQGVCLPACRNDADCDFGDFQDTCDTASGVCVNPATTGSSGSTGSSSSGSTGTSSTGGTTSGATSTTGTGGGTTGSKLHAPPAWQPLPPVGCGCSASSSGSPFALLLLLAGLWRARRRS